MRGILQNKKKIKIISSLLIIFTIFMFSVVFATGESIYVWSSQAEPLGVQSSTETSSKEEKKIESNFETASNTENVIENNSVKANNNTVDKNNANSVSTNNGISNNKNETVNTNISTKNNNTDKMENNLNLESGGAILIEQHSGQILYEHNPHEKLRPASVTKVMSILLIMEALDSGQISLTDKVPCTEDAAAMGGSQIWLDVREELTVDEMLKAICVVSANDCTVQ